jgi:hypothetical protein
MVVADEYCAYALQLDPLLGSSLAPPTAAALIKLYHVLGGLYM